MKTPESSPTTSSQSAYSEQPASIAAAEEKDHSNNFYIVGGVINLVMISAYFIWAFRAWRKSDKRKNQ